MRAVVRLQALVLVVEPSAIRAEAHGSETPTSATAPGGGANDTRSKQDVVVAY